MTTVATHQGPGFTYFARWIGRCPACKSVVKVESPEGQAPAGWFIMHKRSASCACKPLGTNVIVKMVLGSYSDKKCGGACRSAKGPSCDCSCGGEHHGEMS